MVHFMLDSVAALDLSVAKSNEWGTGKAQDPPSMMLDLLVYGCATGTFPSRRIGTPTYENVSVRLLTAYTRLRKQAVEPVFGIIKEALGFRRFLLRSSAKVGIEWSLMSTSYHLKRRFALGMKPSRG